MELLRLDEDRILRAHFSLQEALLNGHCNRKKRTGRAEVLIPAGSTLSGLKDISLPFCSINDRLLCKS